MASAPFNSSMPSSPTADPAAPAVGLGLQIQNLSKIFPASSKASRLVSAIDNLNLTIAPGSFVAVLGPSGCGKSTLLRLIASLVKPTSGNITFTNQTNHNSIANNHVDPIDQRADIACVFQDAHLLPWRNVWRNVALPLELMGSKKHDKQSRQAIAFDALARVGLSDAMDRYPSQLSGGMRMRVSLARALVTRPRLLLLDEPFAALDEITRQHLDEQLRQLWSDTGITVLFITHATAEATYLAQRAIVLSPRPARVIHDAPIALPNDRPRSIRGLPAFAAAAASLYEALELGEHNEHSPQAVQPASSSQEEPLS